MSQYAAKLTYEETKKPGMTGFISWLPGFLIPCGF
jgi:hypothetical protein